MDIPYDAGDGGKKSIPRVIYIKNSYELIKSLKISLNNVIISNEADVNRSSLVNYILNNAKDDHTDYRNLEVNTSTKEDLNITDYQFISKETYFRPTGEDDEDTSDKFHYVNFKIPIFLKDMTEFFKKLIY